MTRVELRDEIVRRSEPDLERQRRTRGWLGVARDLLASVVESGLNLPDAAAAIRGDGQSLHEFQGPPPVATVTLAEIYATQGHYEQSLRMLDEVIEREPEHATARSLRDRISQERDLGPGRRRKVVEAKAETIVTPQPPIVAPVPEPAAVAPATPAPAPVAAAEPAPVAAAPVPAPVTPEPAPAPAPPVAADAPAPVAVPAPEISPEPAPVAVPAPEIEPAPAPEISPESMLAAASPAPTDAPGVVVLQALDRAFVYWRLPQVTPGSRLRSIAVRPSLQGPQVDEHDYPLPVAVGGVWLSRVAPGTEVRAAVGEVSGDGFVPSTVARVLALDETPGFEPPGSPADADLETAARLAAGL
jgi:hypothetical protein